MEVRKKWLYSFVVLNVAVILYSIVGVLIGAKSAMVMFVQNLIFTTLYVSVVMHCSYISRGTRLLAFLSYLYPFSVVGTAIFLAFFAITGQPIVFVQYANVVLSPFLVYFAWMCHKLRKQYWKERLTETDLKAAIT